MRDRVGRTSEPVVDSGLVPLGQRSQGARDAVATTIRELGNRRRIATADVHYAHRWAWICEELAAEFDCNPNEIDTAEVSGREVLTARGEPVAFIDDRPVVERLQQLERTYLERLRCLRQPAPSMRRGAPRRGQQSERT